MIEANAPAEVLALLSEQRDLCRRLDSFAQTQRSLITGDEPERLLALLGDRQQLLDRLIAIGQRLKPIQLAWPAIRRGMDAVQAREADDLLNEVNRLLGGVLQIDEADAQLLSARKESTAQTMKVVGRGRQAGAAYAAAYREGAAAMGNVDWTDE